jgi:Na+/H+ antiporter NhaC
MFAKMNLYFTIFTFLLFLITYYIQNQIIYYRKINNKNEYKENIVSLISVERKLVLFIIFTIILGFALYFIKEYKDKKKEWSFIKFIFGTLHCDFENKKLK